MRIVYLDQNKWIDLARAVKEPEIHRDLYETLVSLAPDLEAGRLVLPLSATNIYETYKIKDPERRHDLAIVQAILSRGLVFRGRHARLEVEVGSFLRSAHGLASPTADGAWFLSGFFLEAFAESGDPRLNGLVPTTLIQAARDSRSAALYSFLVGGHDRTRAKTIAQFSAGTTDLMRRVEARRERDADQPPTMRSAIYNAITMCQDMDLLRDISRRAGVPCTAITDIGPEIARRLMRETPLYNVERELALRLEAQQRALAENDFRDMQAYCAAIPYADLVIGERQFINLARQAGLNKRYRTVLSVNVFDLAQWASLS